MSPDNYLNGPIDQPWPSVSLWQRWRRKALHDAQDPSATTHAWLVPEKAKCSHYYTVSMSTIQHSACGRSRIDKAKEANLLISASFPTRRNRCTFCLDRVGPDAEAYEPGELTPPTPLVDLLTSPVRERRDQGREMLISLGDEVGVPYLSPYLLTVCAYILVDRWDAESHLLVEGAPGGWGRLAAQVMWREYGTASDRFNHNRGVLMRRAWLGGHRKGGYRSAAGYLDASAISISSGDQVRVLLSEELRDSLVFVKGPTLP